MALTDVLESFREQVTGLASAGVVHRSEGTAIASIQGEPASPLDAAAGDAYLAELLKLHERAQRSLGLDASTEDIVLQTSAGTLLARPLGDSDYLWTVVTSPAANVALTRALMRRYHDEVLAGLP